jgi:hypothetical protein
VPLPTSLQAIELYAYAPSSCTRQIQQCYFIGFPPHPIVRVEFAVHFLLLPFVSHHNHAACTHDILTSISIMIHSMLTFQAFLYTFTLLANSSSTQAIGPLDKFNRCAMLAIPKAFIASASASFPNICCLWQDLSCNRIVRVRTQQLYHQIQ